MRDSFRFILMAQLSALAGVPVAAQSIATVAPQAADSAEDGTDSTLEEIVVTAQRRSENLQNVPIAISAITGATAQRIGVTGPDTLAVAAPSLQFQRTSGNGGVPFIRGIGSSQAIAGSEAPVAMYLDDVYIGTPSATIFSFNNIERIEVLKGPQGTLFGRNATGGVIQVRTKRPSQKQQLDAFVGYGRYDTVGGSLYANTPLSDVLAVNIAANGKHQRQGYGRSFTTGEDIFKGWEYAVRGEMLWEPSSETSALLTADYTRSKGDIGLNVVLRPGTVAVGGGTNQGKFVSLNTPPDFSRNSQYGVSLRLDHDAGWARLVSISAYRKSSLFYVVDQESVPLIITATIDTNTKNLTQEFQILSAEDSRLKWIAGSFFMRSRAAYDPFHLTGSSQAPFKFTDLVNHQTLTSFAGFGEVKYDVLPDTNVTVGLRYTRDSYDLSTARFNDVGQPFPGQTFEKEATFSKWTYRAILDHNFTDDVMGYASYSRGFKSGGFNLTAPGVAPGAPAVLPEVLDAYEVGLKTELFDRMLRFNIGAFHYDYSNLQVTVVIPGASRTVNAATSRVKGVDVDFTFAPTRRFTLSGGFAYLDGKYTSFPNGPLYVPNPAVCTPVPQTTGPLSGGNAQCAADLAGNRTVRTPKFSGSITAAYTLPSDVGDFTLSTTLYHNSKFYWEPDNRLTQPNYNLLNATLAWVSSSGRYEARLWGKNLFNEYYFNYSNEATLRDSGSPAMPRSYGVTFGVHL
jgi:iron complex outermembrane recepter protein